MRWFIRSVYIVAWERKGWRGGARGSKWRSREGHERGYRIRRNSFSLRSTTIDALLHVRNATGQVHVNPLTTSLHRRSNGRV